MKNSKYQVSALRLLPPGMFGGDTYSIVTATEISRDLIVAEHFLLIQKPAPELRSGEISLDMTNFPDGIDRWTIETGVEEAQNQVEIDIGLLQESRARALGREELAYIPFEFRQAGTSLMGAWSRGVFDSQIQEIAQKTKSPQLRIYLSFLMQNRILRAPTN